MYTVRAYDEQWSVERLSVERGIAIGQVCSKHIQYSLLVCTLPMKARFALCDKRRSFEKV